MKELERNAIIVAITVLIISTCTATGYAVSYHTQLLEMENEIAQLESYIEEIAYLEDTIEVIVMERTMYIELSFAEIQRLRAELNATKHLLSLMEMP